MTSTINAINLTPVIQDGGPDLATYINGFITAFGNAVTAELNRHG